MRCRPARRSPDGSVRRAWLTAAPAEAGFADRLAARFDKLIADRRVWGAAWRPGRRARGRIVLERYFDGEENNWGKRRARSGSARDTLHNLYSVTKSIVALVYGVALGEGKGPAARGAALRAVSRIRRPDRCRCTARASRRSRHALAMTLGLAMGRDRPALRRPAQRRDRNGACEGPLSLHPRASVVGPPGKRWLYCGGATALVGRLVPEGTGRPLPGLRARRAVRSGRHRPDRMDHQQGHLGRGEIRPRRRRAGRRVRPADDAARSRAHRPARARRRHGERSPGRTGRMARRMLRAARQRQRNPPLRIPMVRRRHGIPRPRASCGSSVGSAASGNGGQRLFVMPELDIDRRDDGRQLQPDQWLPPIRVVREAVLPSLL